MRACENSPVVAAFGVASETDKLRSIASTASTEPKSTVSLPVSHAPVVIEWDVYLDRRVCDLVDSELKQSTLSSERRAALAHQLASTTAISHGSLVHIGLERFFGVSMHQSILQRSGGMTVHAWLHAYFHALATLVPELDVHRPACAVQTTDGDTADADSAAVSPPVPHLSVFLDVKSSSASPAVLQLLTEGINACGVHVWGVGSFVHSQLQAISSQTGPQRVIVPDTTKLAAAGGGVRPVLRTKLGPDGAQASSRHGSNASLAEVDLLLGHEPVPRHERTAAHVKRTKWQEVNPAVTAEGEMPLPREVGNTPHLEIIVTTPEGGELAMTPIPLAPPIAFHIFSFVGEIQQACDVGRVQTGSHILFNGGTMISYELHGTPQATMASYRIDPQLLHELDEYRRRYDLHIGFYTQESLLDYAAADLLVRTANDNTHTFEHGFAYSGLSGSAVEDICPTATSAAIGWTIPWWLRSLIGRSWRLTSSGRLDERTV